MIKSVASVERLTRRIDEFIVGAREELNAAMEQSLATIQEEVVLRTPDGVGGSQTGHLRGTIQTSRAGSNAYALRGRIGSFSDYVEPVEFGSKPHYPPASELVRWVQLKLGIPDEKEALGVAFAIARVKSRTSTLGVFMFRDGIAASDRRVRAYFLRAFRNAERKLGKK